MYWRDLITDIYTNLAPHSSWEKRPEFFPSTSEVQLVRAEECVHGKLPMSFRSLLLETDGVMDMMLLDGGDWFASGWLLYSVEQMIKRNQFCRRTFNDESNQCDISQLVFFADAGCDGIMFGFPVLKGGECDSRVVVWHPLRDTVTELAPTLREFLYGWLTGVITV